ncbi:hypothetical protein, partial [Nocardioides stalactiti]|uniref:hypothetical protein n=1 Tax=Nocardioides stalactiti TaxID=2755356 RepID=UPI0015FFA0E8
DDSPSDPVDPGPLVACPRVTAEADPALPDAVPEGATSVRLCDGGADKVTPPVDALTTDVAAVVAAVNDQPLVARRCVELRVPDYQLAFGYPDGSRFVVAARFTGCAELLVGNGRRDRATPPLRAFVDRLRAQRVAATPPELSVRAGDLDCAQPSSTLPTTAADPTDLSVAVLCFGVPERPERATAVPIPAEDLTILTRSMQHDTASSAGSLGCTPPFSLREHWIVGVSAWGDPVAARRGCFGLTIEGDIEWTPRREERAIIRALVSAAR